MRISTSIITLYLWISASAAALSTDAIGVAQDLGVNNQITFNTGLETAVEGIQTVQGGGISAESLVGVYTIISGSIETLVGGLVAGPEMAIALGIPSELVAFLAAPIPLLAGRLLIYAFSGRDI